MDNQVKTDALFLIDKIKRQVISYLTQSNDIHSDYDIIKTHEKNLSEIGEFSFPLNSFIWHKNNFSCDGFCNTIKKSTIFSCKFKRKLDIDDETNLLLENLKQFVPVEKVKVVNEICYLFLNKSSTYSYVFKGILENEIYSKCTEDGGDRVLVPDTQFTNLSVYRKHLIKTTIKNMLQNIKSCDSSIPYDVDNIHCGPVLDPITGKNATLTLDEYKTLRSTEMQLLAMHKYGVRARDGLQFNNFITKLGEAAVKIDLLEVKHNSSVNIVRNGQGSTKGASFILYNSARLQTLLRKFNKRIEDGIYPNLPSLNEVDLNLLKEKEEWELFFVYIMQFQSMLEFCLKGLKKGNPGNRQCGLHIFIKFLQGLVALFSVYYRRVQILVEYRGHLMPTVQTLNQSNICEF